MSGSRGTRAGRTGDARKGIGQGGEIRKFCPTCNRPVLSSHRRIVEPIAPATIVKVEANGDVRGRCICGGTVTYLRATPRPIVTTG
jgi:hypothetical protein